MVQYSAGGGPALRGVMISAAGKEGKGTSGSEGRTAFAVLLTDNLEFACTIPLNPMLNPGEPGV